MQDDRSSGEAILVDTCKMHLSSVYQDEDKTRNMRDMEYCRKVQSQKPPMTNSRLTALQELHRFFQQHT